MDVSDEVDMTDGRKPCAVRFLVALCAALFVHAHAAAGDDLAAVRAGVEKVWAARQCVVADVLWVQNPPKEMMDRIMSGARFADIKPVDKRFSVARRWTEYYQDGLRCVDLQRTDGGPHGTVQRFVEDGRGVTTKKWTRLGDRSLITATNRSR